MSTLCTLCEPPYVPEDSWVSGLAMRTSMVLPSQIPEVHTCVACLHITQPWEQDPGDHEDRVDPQQKQFVTVRCYTLHVRIEPVLITVLCHTLHCRIEPVIMSAGELEHEWAGTPGRMIRDRYRLAAEYAKNRGRMPCLIINGAPASIFA